MKQPSKKTNFWKFGVLSTLCMSLFVIFACSEEKAAIIGPGPDTDKAEVQREVFTKVEEQPTYKGGMTSFYQQVIKEVKYPLQARKNGIEGTVQVQFVIERNGNISNASVIKGIGSGCDKEALETINQASGFIPGKQRGRTVRTTMVMPITFKLNPDKKNTDGSIQGAVIAGELVSNKEELTIKAAYKNGEWSGTILSPDGDKLPGANIVVEGTSFGTVSDLDGTFSVKADKNQKLQISFVGYNNATIKK